MTCAKNSGTTAAGSTNSPDGLRETHDRIRRPGSYDETLAAIPLLRRAGIHVALMATVSKWNVQEIPALVDVAVEHQADIFAFARYCPSQADRDTTCSPEYWAPEACWRSSRPTRPPGAQPPSPERTICGPLPLREGPVPYRRDPDPDTIYDGCNCGNCHMTILSDGAVYACRRMESMWQRPHRRPLRLFTGPAYEAYRQYDQFEKCAKCELLWFCWGCWRWPPVTTAAPMPQTPVLEGGSLRCNP